MVPPSLLLAQSADHIGVTFAREEVDVTAEISGILESVAVRSGDQVEVGDVLATFRDAPLRRDLSQARAQLAEAEATRDQRRIEFDQAQVRLERRSKLNGILSEEEKAELSSERDAGQAALAAAEAGVRQRETSVAALSDDLARAEIRAPFAGTVSVRYQDPGGLLQPGRPVVRLLSRDLWVRFAVPPALARSLQEGEAVALRGPGDDALRFAATITQIAPDVDPASDLVFVEADIDDAAAGALVVGMVTRVSIPPGVSDQSDR